MIPEIYVFVMIFLFSLDGTVHILKLTIWQEIEREEPKHLMMTVRCVKGVCLLRERWEEERAWRDKGSEGGQNMGKLEMENVQFRPEEGETLPDSLHVINGC